VESLEAQIKVINSNIGRALAQSGTVPSEIPEKYKKFQENANKIIEMATSKGVAKKEIDKYKEFVEKVLT